MIKRVLVPFERPTLPSRALVCFGGMKGVYGGSQQPILLGLRVSEDYLERTVREYLEDKAKELSCMEVKASPLVSRGPAARALLDCAQDSGIGVFLIFIDGPYRLQTLSFGRGYKLESSPSPPRKIVCFEGVAQASRAQPLILGADTPEEDIDHTIKDYLDERARELRSRGRGSGPLFVHSGSAHSLLDIASEEDTGVFLFHLHGPYRTQAVNLGKLKKVAFRSSVYDRAHSAGSIC